MSEPISARYREQMNKLARKLDQDFNPGLTGTKKEVGFVLLVFPRADGQPNDDRCNYIANTGDRARVATVLHALARRFEEAE